MSSPINPINKEVTQQQLEKLRMALDQLPVDPPENVHPVLHQACRDSLFCMITDLEQELRQSQQGE